MENASKALIMAGSVLLSMLIIGALIFMLNSISNLKNTEASSEEIRKLADYNKQIETFNREGVYGSEILSLSNLIEDYNLRQADLKGYQEITFTIEITKDTSIYEAKVYNYKELIDKFKKLESQADNKLAEWNEKQKEQIEISNQIKISVKEATGMNDRRLEELIQIANPNMDSDEIEEKKQEIQNELLVYEEYSNLKSEMTEFKNKRFSPVEVKYDQYNNRVIKMIFREMK